MGEEGGGEEGAQEIMRRSASITNNSRDIVEEKEEKAGASKSMFVYAQVREQPEPPGVESCRAAGTEALAPSRSTELPLADLFRGSLRRATSVRGRRRRG